MEELPPSSFSWLTNKARQRRSQSESLHAFLASSSSPFSATPTQELASTHILMAQEGTLCEKLATSNEETQEEASTCMTSSLKRGDDAEHASASEMITPRESCSQNTMCFKLTDSDVIILLTDKELQKASLHTSTLLDRANDVEDVAECERTNLRERTQIEDITERERTNWQEITHISAVLSGLDDAEQGIMMKAEPQESTHLRESLNQGLSDAGGVNEIEQGVLTKVESIEMPTHQSEGYTQHILQQQISEELQGSVACAAFSNIRELDDDGKQAVQLMEGEDLFATVEDIEGIEFVSDDTVYASSEMRQMSAQEISSSIFSSSHQKSDCCTLPEENIQLQDTCTPTTVIEMSLRQHMQQDDAAREEAATRSFIMNRFLPAAKEVAAEHESSMAAPLMSKSYSEATSPSLPRQCQKIPVSRRVRRSEGPTLPSSHQSRRTPGMHPSKPKAQHATRAFTPLHPLHSWHKEDVMPYSMKSCGFFCQGLKTVLFRAHRTVSASARTTLRKKSWAPHLSNHMKVADAGTSLRVCEMEGPLAKEEARGGKAKPQIVANTYAPVLRGKESPNGVHAQGSPQRRAIKHDLLEQGCSSADARHSFTSSQSAKFDLAGNQFGHMGFMESGHDDAVTARNFAALKEQDDPEIASECVVRSIQQGALEGRSSCHCDHVKTTPLSNSLSVEASPSSSTSMDILGGLKVCSSKPAVLDDALRSPQGEGDHDVDDDDDEEPQFFDALSRLNSLKSNASFYTMGSPRSEYEALRFESLWTNDEGDFTDTSSHFGATKAYESKSASSVLSPVCVATEKGTTGKVSSLSQRIGKGLKLETESKEATSPSERGSPAFKGEWQTESFSGLRHPSLESLNGLYSSKASIFCPVFPAKCQSNSPNALGWPFGISTYQASRQGLGSLKLVQQEKNVEKGTVCEGVPSPPLPPSPTGSWLGKAVTKNASKTSPLATLQQREKVASARKKLDFEAKNLNADRRWENVVKESRVQVGHLRCSEELHHQNHPSNQNAIKPLKL